MTAEGLPHKLGDLVTRDGTDIHRVIEEDDGYGCIRVECVVAPKGGWIKVGETETNLAGRYQPAQLQESGQ